MAVAPALPVSVRFYTIFAGLAVWTGTVIWGTIAAARHASTSLGRNFATLITTLAVIGITVTVLANTQLQVIRVLYERPALTWNIDWRFHLNHVQAIVRSGGLDSALDYAGMPVDYHVGPAWLAAAAERVTGGGIYGISFGLVPLLCILCITIAVLYTLHTHGIPYRLAAAATAIALTVPGLLLTPRGLYHRFTASTVDAARGVWAFSSAMLNEHFGLAVGLTSLALLLDRRARSWHIALACVGLACLVQLKPQVFVALGVLTGLVGIARTVGHGAFAPRNWRILVAAAAALLLGVAAAATLPSSIYGSILAHPVWAPGRTGYSLTETVRNSTLLAVVGLAVWSAIKLEPAQRTAVGVAAAIAIGAAAFDRLPLVTLFLVLAVTIWSIVIVQRREESPGNRCYWLLVMTATSMALLVAALYLISFPVRPTVVAQAQRLVDPTFSATSAQRDVAEAVAPLRLLLVTSALALLTVVASRSSMAWRRVFGIAGFLIVISPVPVICIDFARPARGYEAAEDSALLQALREVPRDSQLLIASDLADPAENYRRPLNAFLLTGYGGHAFYVANLRYVHFTRPDAPRRLAEVQAFFGSSWSAWHAGWLQRTGIGYILVSDRCVPTWADDPALPLRRLGHYGQWTVYQTQSARLGVPDSMPVARTIVPRFGTQGCLSANGTGS